MANWIKTEHIGDIQQLDVDVLVSYCIMHNQRYKVDSELHLVEFEIDGIPYVLMTKQDFKEWFGE